jgi:thiamine biosynthesis lipoprotein
VNLLRWLLLLGCIGLLRAAETASVSGRAMGTTWRITWIQPATPLDPETVRRAVVTELERLEEIFSTYRPRAEVGRVNRAASTDWIEVSPELATVAALAARVSERSDGAFDVTVAPLLTLWGVGPEGGREHAPARAELDAARALVGWRQLLVRVQPPALRKSHPALRFDPSSLAKGWAVDALIEILGRIDCHNVLIALGGDLRGAGAGPDGAGWPVGIERPDAPPAAIARVITLRNAALSTSGNYRNAARLDGHIAGHIVDPRTGRPAASALGAASVVQPTCALSSALATTLMVLGPEEALTFATREGVACLLQVRAAEGWRQITSATFPAPVSP